MLGCCWLLGGAASCSPTEQKSTCKQLATVAFDFCKFFYSVVYNKCYDCLLISFNLSPMNISSLWMNLTCGRMSFRYMMV